MDDIVNRLRDHQNGGRRAECEEAANQIEALRDMLDSARVDLEMLREALGVPVEPHQSLLERMVEAAQAKRGAVPDGWQVVPKEPTPEMLDAYVKNNARFHSARSDWASMLAAAPAPDQFRDAAEMVSDPAEVQCSRPNVACAAPDCGPECRHKQPAPAEVPSADQLWNNDEVMALNAKLGLTTDQLSRLVRAAMRAGVKP